MILSNIKHEQTYLCWSFHGCVQTDNSKRLAWGKVDEKCDGFCKDRTNILSIYTLLTDTWEWAPTTPRKTKIYF